jgi:uncharacterized membrane protein YkvA (DUF1232 family)
VLVFCHCPKTAGTSLFRAISLIYGQHRSYQIKRARPNLKALGARGVEFVAGHAPQVHYAALGAEGLRFITVVRDPVQTTLSVFLHCARHRYLWPEAMEFFDADLPARGLALNAPESVRMFLRRYPALMGIRWDNLQVRFAVDKPHEPLSAADLEAAQRSFAAMDVVGVTERFEATLELLALTFGWNAVEFGRYGASAEAQRPIPDPRLVGEIEAATALDRELTAWARERFDAALAAARAARVERGAAAPTIIASATRTRRFTLAWAREWIALARPWTPDDWRWWGEVTRAMMTHRARRRWRAAEVGRDAWQELRIFATLLFDWRSCWPARLCLVLGLSYLFVPLDIVPDRIPVLGHSDEASFVLGGLTLGRLLVPHATVRRRRTR